MGGGFDMYTMSGCEMWGVRVRNWGWGCHFPSLTDENDLEVGYQALRKGVAGRVGGNCVCSAHGGDSWLISWFELQGW